MRLVLASRSPRRADLLTSAGYDFEVAPADIDERLLDGETPAAHVCRLAREKAARVAWDHPGAIVLGADTVVVIDAVMLGNRPTMQMPPACSVDCLAAPTTC